MPRVVLARPVLKSSWYRIVVIGIVTSILVACGSGEVDDDRRFANDPVTPQPTSTFVESPEAEQMATEGISAIEASPALTLVSSNTPESVYQLVSGRIVAIDPDGSTPSRLIPFDGEIVAIDSTLASDRIAVLTHTHSVFSVALIDVSGNELGRWDVPGEAAAATPVATSSSEARPGTIAWSTDETRLLVTIGDGRLISLDTSGSATAVELPKEIAGIEVASWSPGGREIAIQGRDDEGNGTLWIYVPNVDGVGVKRLIPATDDERPGSVISFAWLPNGDGVLALISDGSSGGPPGGQLHVQMLGSKKHTIVASAGVVGPASRITNFAISPDGSSVAYTISSPDDDRWVFDGLWVRSITDGVVYEVPIDQVTDVHAMVWVDHGLVLQQQNGPGAAFLYVTSDGQVSEIANPLAAVAASPEASPALATPAIESPEATPVPATPVEATPLETPVEASPQASPIASPVASPMASPVASPVATPSS